MNYIKELIENSYSIDNIKEKLNRYSNISIINVTILGVPSILIKQNNKQETLDSIYNNYDFIIISNKLDLITMSLPKIIETSSIYSSTDYNLNNNVKDLIIEELINGNYVVVSKYNDDIMVSTKSNLYATNFIPGTKESYYNCLVQKFENYSPYDIDILFNDELKNYIWIFNITNNKEIYLITAYNRLSLKEMSKSDLLIYSGKFKLRMPKFEYINNKNDVKIIKNKFYAANKNLKGIIYNNIKTNYREKELKIKEIRLSQHIYSNSRYILYKITNSLFKEKIEIVKYNFNKYLPLIDLLDLKFKKQYKKIEQVFDSIKNFKTKKQIANCLKEFEFNSFLFNNLTEINFKDFGEYYKSKKILTLSYSEEEIENLLSTYIIPILNGVNND